MKKLGFHPATMRRASYALSSPTTPPVTLRMPRDFTCAASARRSARDKVGSPLPFRTSEPRPLRSILLALTEHVGLDPERGTEPYEGRVGQRQLLVRRRRQRPVAVLLEEDRAGSEIESDGRRACWGDVGDVERTGEPALQLRVLGRPRRAVDAGAARATSAKRAARRRRFTRNPFFGPDRGSSQEDGPLQGRR